MKMGSRSCDTTGWHVHTTINK